MISIIDHDDFKKSRKSVMVTSILLIASSSFGIETSTADFFGVRFQIDEGSIRALLSLSLCYFLYVFSFRAFEYYGEIEINEATFVMKELDEMISNIDKPHRRILDLVDHGLDSDRAETLSATFDEVDKIAKDVRNISMRLSTTRRVSGFIVDIFPAILFSYFALFDPNYLPALASTIF